MSNEKRRQRLRHEPPPFVEQVPDKGTTWGDVLFWVIMIGFVAGIIGVLLYTVASAPA